MRGYPMQPNGDNLLQPNGDHQSCLILTLPHLAAIENARSLRPRKLLTPHTRALNAIHPRLKFAKRVTGGMSA